MKYFLENDAIAESCLEVDGDNVYLFHDILTFHLRKIILLQFLLIHVYCFKVMNENTISSDKGEEYIYN